MKGRQHVIRDQAIHLMLDYCQEAEAIYGEKPQLHHTLEHLENFQIEDIARLGRSHVLPSVQPAHVLCDITGVERDLGPERSRIMWPFRSMLDTGCTLAFGTDSPVVDMTPRGRFFCHGHRPLPRSSPIVIMGISSKKLKNP